MSEPKFGKGERVTTIRGVSKGEPAVVVDVVWFSHTKGRHILYVVIAYDSGGQSNQSPDNLTKIDG